MRVFLRRRPKDELEPTPAQMVYRSGFKDGVEEALRQLELARARGADLDEWAKIVREDLRARLPR